MIVKELEDKIQLMKSRGLINDNSVVLHWADEFNEMCEYDPGPTMLQPLLQNRDFLETAEGAVDYYKTEIARIKQAAKQEISIAAQRDCVRQLSIAEKLCENAKRTVEKIKTIWKDALVI